MPRTESEPTPKFGSFKPKNRIIGTKLHSQDGRTSQAPTESGSEEKLAERRRPEVDDRPRKRRRREDPCSDRVEHEVNVNGMRPGIESTAGASAESRLFIVDRRGDAKNVEYGGLHRYSVPNYHRRGCGCLIGTPSNLKIDRDAISENRVSLRNADEDGSKRTERVLTSKRAAADIGVVRLVVRIPRDKIVEDELREDFISFGSSRKRRQSEEFPDLVDSRVVDYRSIEGNAKPKDETEIEDLEFDLASDDEALPNASEARLRQENATLSKKCKEQPADANAWLELLEHQHRLLRPSVDVLAMTHREQRALADVRLSICEQALKRVTKDVPGFERILTILLYEGSMIWERSRLSKKWQEVLHENPSSVSLWTKYLDFAQTEHIDFKFTRCRETYLKCLQVLRLSYDSATTASKLQIALNYVYVFLRLTAFTRDAGYDELALSMWQIILELQFFGPQKAREQDDNLQSLEDFWESDVPRIGESGALGWREHAKTQDRAPRSVATIIVEALDSTRPIASFADIETQLHRFLHLPTATDDVSMADDPFRAVMFSDLKDVVMTLPESLPKHALIGAFLLFIRLPPLPLDGENAVTQLWQTDQFLRFRPGDGCPKHDQDGAPARPFITIPNCRSMVHALFSQLQDSIPQHNESIPFVDRVLERLVAAVPDDDPVVEYHMVFRLVTDPENVARTVKRLLKARPSSLRLYNVYALSEAHHGRLDKAREIWTTALHKSSAWEDHIGKDAIYLQHSWMKTEIRGHAETNALNCLVAIPEPTGDTRGNMDIAPISTTARLRSCQFLEIRFEQSLYEQRADRAALYADCHAWLSYLVDDLTIEAALPTYTDYTDKLAKYPSAREQLHQLKAELMRYHIDRKRAYRPAVIRNELEQSIRLFPNNSMILEMHADIRASFRIDNRIRTSLRNDRPCETEITVVGWSSAIAEEWQRASTEGFSSTLNSVRAVFRQALLGPESTAKHSAVLWNMWLQFELDGRPEKTVSTGQALQRATQVFLDGMRHLPWSKHWIVEGLSAFSTRGGMSDKELRQVYDVLAERELRVRANAEEVELVLSQVLEP